MPALQIRFFPSKKMARLNCTLVWIAAILVATTPLYGWGKMVYHPPKRLQ